MTILVLPSGQLIHAEEDLDRLRRLVADVEALTRGAHPSPASLASAPVIEDWMLAARAAPCLMGQFHGHPTIRRGHGGRTSDIWIHAPAHGYARTLSRWYRLGDPVRATGGDR